MINSQQAFLSLLVHKIGMPPAQAQHFAQVLPIALQKQGVDVTKIPPKILFQLIEKIYGAVTKSKKNPKINK